MSNAKKESRLQAWDPAADREPPGDQLAKGIRSRLAGAPAPAWRREGRRRRRIRLSLAAAVAATLLVALTLGVARFGRPPGPAWELPVAVEAAPAGRDEVRMVYTASNGVRVYWSLGASESARTEIAR